MTVKTFRAISAARASSSIAVPLVRRSTIPCVEMRSPSSPTSHHSILPAWILRKSATDPLGNAAAFCYID